METKLKTAETIARKLLAGEPVDAKYEHLCSSADHVEFERVNGLFDKRAIWKNIDRRTRPRIRFGLRIAAAVAAVILAGAGWWLGTRPERGKNITGTESWAGLMSATLVLDDGSEIALSGDTTLTAAGGTVAVDGRRVRHLSSGGTATGHATLQVPRGTVWMLELEDGSTVWLNSDSKLRYPVAFGSGGREVTLDGEAFFEVEPDPLRPFTVRSGAMRTTVLGTTFNVSAYGDEPEIKTTLVSGSVEVAVDGIESTKILRPSTRALWIAGTGVIEVAEVNAAAETSWRNGIMTLDETGLDEIMRMISRWYNVEVEYRGDTVVRHNFTGRIDRRDDLRTILEKLTLLGAPRFEIEDNRVIVH